MVTEMSEDDVEVKVVNEITTVQRYLGRAIHSTNITKWAQYLAPAFQLLLS